MKLSTIAEINEWASDNGLTNAAKALEKLLNDNKKMAQKIEELEGRLKPFEDARDREKYRNIWSPVRI